MRGVSRLGRVVVLLLCVVVVAVLAGVSLTDPFHLRQARWFTAGLIALGLVLLTALLATGAPAGPAALGDAGRRRGRRARVGRVRVRGEHARGGGRQVAEADDAGRRLVTLEARRRPAYAVVVRSGGGPFEQESLVYQGVAGAPAPDGAVRRHRTVEVAVGTCHYRSGVEAATLAV